MDLNDWFLGLKAIDFESSWRHHHDDFESFWRNHHYEKLIIFKESYDWMVLKNMKAVCSNVLDLKFWNMSVGLASFGDMFWIILNIKHTTTA
jgi:hypothetical protein